MAPRRKIPPAPSGPRQTSMLSFLSRAPVVAPQGARAVTSSASTTHDTVRGPSATIPSQQGNAPQGARVVQHSLTSRRSVDTPSQEGPAPKRARVEETTSTSTHGVVAGPSTVPIQVGQAAQQSTASVEEALRVVTATRNGSLAYEGHSFREFLEYMFTRLIGWMNQDEASYNASDLAGWYLQGLQRASPGALAYMSDCFARRSLWSPRHFLSLLPLDRPDNQVGLYMIAIQRRGSYHTYVGNHFNAAYRAHESNKLLYQQWAEPDFVNADGRVSHRFPKSFVLAHGKSAMLMMETVQIELMSGFSVHPKNATFAGLFPRAYLQELASTPASDNTSTRDVFKALMNVSPTNESVPVYERISRGVLQDLCSTGKAYPRVHPDSSVILTPWSFSLGRTVMADMTARGFDRNITSSVELSLEHHDSYQVNNWARVPQDWSCTDLPDVTNLVFTIAWVNNTTQQLETTIFQRHEHNGGAYTSAAVKALTYCIFVQTLHETVQDSNAAALSHPWRFNILAGPPAGPHLSKDETTAVRLFPGHARHTAAAYRQTNRVTCAGCSLVMRYDKLLVHLTLASRSDMRSFHRASHECCSSYGVQPRQLTRECVARVVGATNQQIRNAIAWDRTNPPPARPRRA
ncbi:hypothetical protein AMS68_004123 [Peltaster fructicola]|uniref:Uncharacterized protein n=1 Tax=Peltaster fructicola TaxID=286661 RepID=A0A6H0XV92_9PEZI|nr:hypothetical protein AMS68_004123 [Peltaster fructicola]